MPSRGPTAPVGPTVPGWLFPTAGLAALALGCTVVLGAPAAVGLAGVLAVAAVVLLLRRVDVLLHLLVLSVFVESVGVGPARVGRVLAVVAVLVLLGRLLFTSWRPPGNLSFPVLVPAALFCSWAWASGLWASNAGAWTFAMGQLGLAVAYFLAFVSLVERVEQVRELLRTYVVGALFAASVAFVQVLGGADRAVGLQGDPNIYAMYQVAALPAAALIATTTRPERRWAAYAVLPVLVASVLATQSRGGLLATLVVLLLLLLRGDLGPTLRRHRTAAVTTGLLVSVGSLVALTTFSRRFALDRVSDDRGSGRADIWLVAFRAWQDHPVLGLGGGGFKPRSVELLATEPGVELVRSRLLRSDGIEVHNIYLETLVEYGLVGCLLFVSLLLATWLGLRVAARRSGDPVLRALPTVLIAFLAASVFLSVVNNKLLWTLAGLSVVAAARTPLAGPSGGPAPAVRSRWSRRVRVGGPAASLVTVTAALGLVGGLLVSVLLPVTHVATAQYVVAVDASPPEREATVRTLEALISGPVVAEDVRAATGTDLSAEQVQDRIRISRPEGSLVFTAAVRDRDRARATALAEALTVAFPARVDEVGTSGSEDRRGYSLRLWAGGTVTTAPAPRETALPAVLGGVLGAALGLLVVAGLSARRDEDSPSEPDDALALAAAGA